MHAQKAGRIRRLVEQSVERHKNTQGQEVGEILSGVSAREVVGVVGWRGELDNSWPRKQQQAEQERERGREASGLYCHHDRSWLER